MSGNQSAVVLEFGNTESHVVVRTIPRRRYLVSRSAVVAALPDKVENLKPDLLFGLSTRVRSFRLGIPAVVAATNIRLL
jgi:hypothetical protein